MIEKFSGFTLYGNKKIIVCLTFKIIINFLIHILVVLYGIKNNYSFYEFKIYVMKNKEIKNKKFQEIVEKMDKLQTTEQGKLKGGFKSFEGEGVSCGDTNTINCGANNYTCGENTGNCVSGCACQPTQCPSDY